MVPVTAFFAGLLALLYMVLSVNIIVKRYTLKQGIGDGGDKNMAYRIRAHGNFAEYVPFILILMGANELNGASPMFLKMMGAMLVLGRLSHAFSLSHFELAKGKIVFRQIGMVSTFTPMILLAFAALF